MFGLYLNDLIQIIIQLLRITSCTNKLSGNIKQWINFKRVSRWLSTYTIYKDYSVQVRAFISLSPFICCQRWYFSTFFITYLKFTEDSYILLIRLLKTLCWLKNQTFPWIHVSNSEPKAVTGSCYLVHKAEVQIDQKVATVTLLFYARLDPSASLNSRLHIEEHIFRLLFLRSLFDSAKQSIHE